MNIYPNFLYKNSQHIYFFKMRLLPTKQETLKKLPRLGEPVLLAPYELTTLARTPTVDAELICGTCDRQSVFLGGDTLADVHIVDAFAEPDADIALAAHRAVQDCGDLFGSAALDTSNADLPSGLVTNDFAVAESQAVIFGDVADGADVNAAVSDVSHSDNLLFFWGVPLCCIYYIIGLLFCQVFFSKYL